MTAETPSNINPESESTISYAADDEDMIAHFSDGKRLDTDVLALVSGHKHLRYKTRAFAAEYVVCHLSSTLDVFQGKLFLISKIFANLLVLTGLVVCLTGLT